MYSEQKEALAQEIELKRPAVLAVSGLHNSGKTTLLEKLLPALRSRGLKVGIIKHDGHDFTPDVPGTDSYRLREAGAEGVAVYSGQRYLLTEMFRLTEQEFIGTNNKPYIRRSHRRLVRCVIFKIRLIDFCICLKKRINIPI